MRVRLLPPAERDLLESSRFYQNRAPSLAARFLQTFEAAVGEIYSAPQRWPLVDDQVRRYPLTGFPFGIFYTVEDDSLIVYGVIHDRRNPEVWRNRLNR